MGINYWGAGVGSKGAKAAATTAATQTHNIDGSPGKRLAILSYSCTPPVAAEAFYFMVPLAHTTLSAAALSGATNISMTTTPSDFGTSDVVVIVLDDGTYQWTTVGASAVSVNKLTSALTGAAAAGNDVWYLGVYTDEGHYRVNMIASTTKEETSDTGIFFGSYKGGPMRMHYTTAGSSLACIGYVSYAYIDK